MVWKTLEAWKKFALVLSLSYFVLYLIGLNFILPWLFSLPTSLYMLIKILAPLQYWLNLILPHICSLFVGFIYGAFLGETYDKYKNSKDLSLRLIGEVVIFIALSLIMYYFFVRYYVSNPQLFP